MSASVEEEAASLFKEEVAGSPGSSLELVVGGSSPDGRRTRGESTEHSLTAAESPSGGKAEHVPPPTAPESSRHGSESTRSPTHFPTSTVPLTTRRTLSDASLPARPGTPHLKPTRSVLVTSPMESLSPLATHRKGVLRRKVPTDNVLTATKDSITQPMIATRDKQLKKAACDMFKLVQQFMGDRKSKESNMDKIALDICSLCWERRGLIDELYMQLCRQTTGNPDLESLWKGWQLFAIALAFFPPSAMFASYIEGFIWRHVKPLPENEGTPVEVYARYCHRRVEKVVRFGGKRGLKEPTLEEVIHAKNAPFLPPLFGATLEEVMELQAKTHPKLTIPWVVPALCDVVLSLKGPETEKIFRKPGHIHEVDALKVQVEKGSVPVESLRDPHVPASLLKLWFRELEEPLIPEEYYERCIANSGHHQSALPVVATLPDTNRELLHYLIRFLKHFTTPESTSSTKMGVRDIAMVWAPNIFRCLSDDPELIAQNNRKEIEFLCLLLEYLNVDVS